MTDEPCPVWVKAAPKAMVAGERTGSQDAQPAPVGTPGQGPQQGQSGQDSPTLAELRKKVQQANAESAASAQARGGR